MPRHHAASRLTPLHVAQFASTAEQLLQHLAHRGEGERTGDMGGGAQPAAAGEIQRIAAGRTGAADLPSGCGYCTFCSE